MRQFYKLLSLLLVVHNVFILPQTSKQVIGHFPVMDGGFEGQVDGFLVGVGGVDSLFTEWTAQFENQGIIVSGGARTGNKFVRFINGVNDGSSTARIHSPGTDLFQEETTYTVQLYYKGDFAGSTFGDIRGGILADGPIYGTFELAENQSEWTKYTRTINTDTASLSEYDVGIVSTREQNDTCEFHIDDFVIYQGNLDNVPPPPVPDSSVSLEIIDSDIQVSWTAPSDVSDVEGYLVLRTIGPRDFEDPINYPSPNVNGIYAVGNIIGEGTPGEGVVISIIPESALQNYSITDTAAAADSLDYHYYVWTVDKAYYYSTNPSVLPVELESTNAALLNKAVVLQWTTLTEVNNYGFDIQKSFDGVNWNKIGFVSGNGNSNSVKNYSFTDKDLPQPGNYYYRLKQINNDGTFEYSNAVSINVGTISDYYLTQNFPNPFNPETKIKFSVKERSKSSLIVYDVLGNEVQKLFDDFAEPDKIYEINFNGSGLSSGVYYYRFISGNSSEIKKMILLK